jgi:hypothetical protein
MRRIPRLHSASGLSALLNPSSRRLVILPLGENCRSSSSRHATRQLQTQTRPRAFGTTANRAGKAENEAEFSDLEIIDEADEHAASTTLHLRVPGRLVEADAPDAIVDSSYTPAESGVGLEEVGGLEKYWENEYNWDPAMVFEGFGPRQLVTDPAALEVITRRAVVEALAAQQLESSSSSEVELIGRWPRGQRQQQNDALALEIVVGEDGLGTLKGDMEPVAQALRSSSAEESVEIEAEEEMSADEARELIASWDPSWKNLRIEGVQLQFAVCVITKTACRYNY